MASSKDVRDMLGLDPNAAPQQPAQAKKKAKPAPTKGLRGINRELNQLIGERAAPVAVIDSAKTYRAKQNLKKPARKWVLQPFINPARSDGLILRHWRHKARQPRRDAEDGDVSMADDAEALDSEEPFVEKEYSFAKCNIGIQTPEYTDEQYNQYLQDGNWSREETDYLMEMVKEYYQRWALIVDRWDFIPKAQANRPQERDSSIRGTTESQDRTPKSSLEPKTEISNSTDSTQATAAKDSFQDANVASQHQPSSALVKPRTMEDLKARYYSISAQMMAVKTPGGLRDMNEEEFRQHEILTKYNPHRETQRKNLVAGLMKRSMDDIMEEENLIAELQRIMVSQQKLQSEREELRARLDLFEGKNVGSSYTSSQELQELVGRFMVANRDRKRMGMNGNLRLSVGDGMQNGGMAYANGTPMTAQSRDSFGGQKRASMGASMSATSTGGPPSAGGLVKQLSDKDKRRFGVSNIERLQAGMVFPTDRITKLRSGKSNTQTQKLGSALAELGIPDVISMPVEQVVSALESVVSKVLKVMDVKKVLEKEEGEIKVAKHLREERKRRESGISGDGMGEGVDMDTTMLDGDEEKAEGDGDAARDGDDAEADADENADADADADEDADGADDDAEVELDAEGEEEEDVDVAVEEEDDDDAQADADADEEDDEANGVQEDEGPPSRPTSSHVRPSSNRSRTPMSTRASRKRSASVISAASGASLAKRRR